jgi:biofilm PGA synthesis lipoprotein PgaB
MRLFALLMMLFAAPCQAIAADTFQVLVYHQVVDDVRNEPDRFAVDASQLVAQFAWLRENGYQPVSLSQVTAARDAGEPLPARAVLITFDDGYETFYRRVFPLLKQFRYPAVLALVGEWMDARPGEPVEYEGRRVPREDFVTWDQVREMEASGLVEVASHSYALHKGVPGNPQGNTLPAAVARRYDMQGARYEDDAAYRERVRADLARNSALIARETGHRPRAMVWPFGRYNASAVEIAGGLGMPITLTTYPGRAGVGRLAETPRALLTLNPDLRLYLEELRDPPRPSPVRVVHVDLDYVYDPDPENQEANLGRLLDRIKALKVNTVYLQAYADPDGNGAADAVYFPNRRLPMRADLFNRVAWQLASRCEVQVFAWMPVLAFELPASDPAATARVETAAAHPVSGTPPRLSPFSPPARAAIFDIYEDLARHAVFDGLLFSDDATLTDYEDASPPALDVYSRDWGLPASIEAIRADPAAFARWSTRKTEALTQLTQEITRRALTHRAPLLTARNIFARVVIEPEAETWYAQSFANALVAYDQVAVMAMPRLEQVQDKRKWLDALVRKAGQTPGALAKTVFELQARDWRSRTPVPTAELAQQMRDLQLLGALNYGYYPDDFHADQPVFAVVRPAISLSSQPR